MRVECLTIQNGQIDYFYDSPGTVPGTLSVSDASTAPQINLVDYSEAMEIYLSVMSNRMTEVMKTLTVISTIFIPLTFIAGIYGMNFDTSESPLNMPELDWYWGYPFIWILMLLIAAGLIYFFWKRGWFKNSL